MKKIIVLGLIVLVFLCLAGCKKEAPKESVLSVAVFPEDYRKETGGMMLTEQGYYYCSMENRDLHYYDFATGTDMYLCNKPECKHDGNKFCVATNDKYRIDRVCLYGGRIFATAVEETDTAYLFKVLQIALDGSEMNEFVTYYTLEKTGVTTVEYADDSLFIHRNRMVIPMQVKGQGEDTTYYGTAWVNLDTKEVSYSDEEVLSKENIALTHMDGFGEYIFYCKQVTKKKMELYRYHMTDGTEETFKLVTSFGGQYEPLDENTVVYIRKNGRTFFVYDHTTGNNEEKQLTFTFTEHFHDEDGADHIWEHDSEAVGLRYDGTYFYVADKSYLRGDGDPEGSGEKVIIGNSYLHVFDGSYKKLAEMNVEEELTRPKPWNSYAYLNKYLHHSDPNVHLCYFGDTVYGVWSKVEAKEGHYVVKFNRSDLLAGNPEYELVLKELP
ncbi:MAG: hypothetical protein IKT67_01025 [Lachnospiraceae bacterium]|nr:hypothetical protein [Lachnospiraceae bacterium]